MPKPPVLTVLDSITIASPCSARWDEMRGDDRVCGQCQQSVYDLSRMTTAEATRLLDVEGPLPCVRLYRRLDGRVMTSDCPIGVRERIWQRLRRRSALAAGVFAFVFLPGSGLLSSFHAGALSGTPEERTERPERSAQFQQR